MTDFSHLVERLRCPECRSIMRQADDGFVCLSDQCRRWYPIVDNIPVLRPDRAKVLGLDEWKVYHERSV